MGRIIPYIMENKECSKPPTSLSSFPISSSNGAAFFYSRPPPPPAAAGAAAAFYIRPGTPRRGEANGDGSMANLAENLWECPQWNGVIWFMLVMFHSKNTIQDEFLHLSKVGDVSPKIGCSPTQNGNHWTCGFKWSYPARMMIEPSKIWF